MSGRPPPQYREDIDLAVCAAPGCSHDGHRDGLFLRSACHPASASSVSYRDGILTIRCWACGKSMTEIAVASRAVDEVHEVHFDGDSYVDDVLKLFDCREPDRTEVAELLVRCVDDALKQLHPDSEAVAVDDNLPDSRGRS